MYMVVFLVVSRFCIVDMNDTHRRMRALYIYSAPVSGNYGYIPKIHSTISYNN